MPKDTKRTQDQPEPTGDGEPEVDDSTRQSMENAARNAGYPTTAGDYEGEAAPADGTPEDSGRS